MDLNAAIVPCATASLVGNFSSHGEGQFLSDDIAAWFAYALDIALSVWHSHGLSATPVAVIQLTMSVYVTAVSPIPELTAGPRSRRISAKYVAVGSGNLGSSPCAWIISIRETLLPLGTDDTQAINLA